MVPGGKEMFQHRHSAAASKAIAAASAATEIGVIKQGRPDPRRRLLDAIIETVALWGYDRTTVGRVLSGAEVEEAVFSEHFCDKHDCFMQAVDDLLGRVEQAALERFQRAAPWPERVQLALQSLLVALANNPAGARVALVEMLGAGPEACKRQRSTLTLFTTLIEEGRSQSSDTSALPAQTSEAIVGGIASIVQRRILQDETAALPYLHADLTYFALLPYLDHERALRVARSPTP
jgi:AcrR family transcriptional regulator